MSKQRYSGAINVTASEGFRCVFSHPVRDVDPIVKMSHIFSGVLLFCFQDQLEAAYDEVRCKFNPPIEVFGTHGIQRNVTSLKSQNSDVIMVIYFLFKGVRSGCADVRWTWYVG